MKEKGFTLVEMLIVLLIITVLILLIIPNVTDNSEAVHDKGCKALKETVQAQVSAYQLEKGKLPTTLDDLVTAGFISSDQKKCQNGKRLILQGKNVSIE
ncbi:MAG TPA: competence type IV pilus major pilin ComGC [Pseudogracilibacillus sp.]|nr:competence type IV pilus major pilin ComGC [Pseudogracilibacillus sp.]